MEVERVQSVAMTYKKKGIPTEFMQPEKTSAEGGVLEVPTIDLGEADDDTLVEVISKASQEWGLFQVVNHGIPCSVIERLQRAGKEFFELPQSEKEVYSVRPPGYVGHEGYANSLSSTPQPSHSPPSPRPWVDHLFHNIWPPSAVNYHFWPKIPPSYRSANEEYGVYLRGVTEKLMKCWAKGLEVEEERLKEAAGGEEIVYLAKINYYPPCPSPELALGVPPHTDVSLLTILVPNHIPGLQVCRDSLWYNVHYIPNALIIHIGDQLEVLSNGKYKAVLHRTTVNKDETRMSWPVFIEPPPHHVVGPLPELLITHQPHDNNNNNNNNNNNPPASYKTKKYADYKYCKLNKLPQ